MKKRLVLLFCILSCVLMVAGCSLVKENDNFDKATMEEQTDSFIQNWFDADFTGTIEAYKDQMDETTLAQYQEFAEMQERYQGVEKKIKTEFTITSDSATVNETVLCKNGEKVIVSLTFGEDGNIETDDSGMYVFKFDEYKTLGQKMGKAGLNTIMSMAIVFAVLIAISLLISSFILFNSSQKKQTAAESTQPVAAPAAATEENLVDDLELVAVITAAIAAASETESADGLVVRSIIRRG